MCLLLLTVILLSTSGLAAGIVDQTRQADIYGQLVVDTTIKVLREACIIQDHLFLRRLAFYESNYGIKNSLGTNNGGIWRVDQAMFNATKTSALRLKDMYLKIKTNLNIDWATVTWDDMRKPLYSAMAVVLYLKSVTSEAIPVKSEYQALYWERYYRRGGNIQTFTNTIQLMIEGCSIADQADIVFILETSSHMTIKDMAQSKLLMKNLIDQLNIDPNLTRVAIVTFGSVANVELYLNGASVKSDIINVINKISQTSGSVNTQKALNLTMYDVLKETNGARKEASHTVILLTKSQPDSSGVTEFAASLLTGSGIILYVLGVGNGGNDSSLVKAASVPSCEHFIHAATFEDLMNHQTEILEKICQEASALDNGIYTYPCNVDALLHIRKGLLGHNVSVHLTQGERTLYGSSNYKVPDETIYDVKETISLKLPWSTYIQNGSDFYINIKSTFGQTCVGDYVVEVSDAYLTTTVPTTTATTTTPMPTSHVDVVCIENGIKRNCTANDLLHSSFGSLVTQNKTSTKTCANNITIAPDPHDPTRFLLCDPQGQLLTVQCPKNEAFCPATKLCQTKCSVLPGLPVPSPTHVTTTAPVNGSRIVLVFTTRPFNGGGGNSHVGIFIHTTSGVPSPPLSGSHTTPHAVVTSLRPNITPFQSTVTSSQSIVTSSQSAVTSSMFPVSFGPNPQTVIPSTNVPTTKNNCTNPCTSRALLLGELYHPGCDESSYYHCSGLPGVASLEHCPPDKIYNPNIPGCVNKYIYDEDRNQFVKSVKNPCKGVNGDVFFAHPTDQTKFIHCDGHWNGFMRSCSSGEIYSVLSNSCIGSVYVG